MNIEVLDDFDKELKPRNKQQEIFGGLDGRIQEVLFGGAAGGSKTFTIITDPLFKKCNQIEGFQAAYFRRDFTQIQESLEIESAKWYPRFGFQYNSTDHEWYIKRNNRRTCRIKFIHCELEKDIFKHDSAAYDALYFDELTQFTEGMYRYLFHRNRPNVANWIAYTRATATPGDIGNAWVRDRFVIPGGPSGYKIINSKQDDGKYIKRMFIPSFAADNPVLMARQPDYLTKLQVLPEALKKAKLYGDWWAFQGQVFTEFRAIKYPDEPSNALHVIDPIFNPMKPPKTWPKILIIDPGYRHFTWVGWGAISPEKQLIVYKELMIKETDIKIWATDVKRMSQYDGVFISFVCDGSAWDEEGIGTSIIDQIQKATGWTFRKANKDRIGGKMLIHELLRWKERPVLFEPVSKEIFDYELSQRIFRVSGNEAYQEYINQFVPDDTAEVLPKVLIFNTCPAVINQIQSVVYDDKKIEDVKKQDGDDPYDGFRYMCQEFNRLVSGNFPEMEREGRITNAVEALNKSGDWNAYYHIMAAIEKDFNQADSFSLREIRSHRRVI